MAVKTTRLRSGKERHCLPREAESHLESCREEEWQRPVCGHRGLLRDKQGPHVASPGDAPFKRRRQEPQERLRRPPLNTAEISPSAYAPDKKKKSLQQYPQVCE